MNRSFRRALLSSALLPLPVDLAFAAADPDSGAEEETQLQDKGARRGGNLSLDVAR